MANPSVSNRASDLLPTGGPCSIQSSSMLLLQRESPITQVWRPLRRACVKVTITSKQDIDRKSTRLNSSHLGISYAVFCLKKKQNKEQQTQHYDVVCGPGTDKLPSDVR